MCCRSEHYLCFLICCLDTLLSHSRNVHNALILPSPPSVSVSPHYFTLVSWDCILNEISWPNFFVSASVFKESKGRELVQKRSLKGNPQTWIIVKSSYRRHYWGGRGGNLYDDYNCWQVLRCSPLLASEEVQIWAKSSCYKLELKLIHRLIWFIKFYWNTIPCIHLCVVHCCFCAVFSNCDRGHMSHRD